MIRPIDKTNPYEPPKPLSPDDRKLSRDLNTESDRYIGELSAPRKPLDAKSRKLSRDMDTETNDFLAKMGALYGRGGA
jgi:hypothetical protein